MTKERLVEIIRNGEGIGVEFKTANFKLPRDIFETVSAFLNRHGGDLILGVTDNGQIDGFFDDSVEQLKKDFVSGCNDTNRLNPTYYLSVEEFTIENCKVLYIRVPESSQVHKTQGKIFDRNEDGDFDITENSELVSQLYLRKQSTYTENKIYPHLGIQEFKPELFQKIRTLVKNQTPNHHWISLSNEEMLRSAGLLKTDYTTGEEGFTLASVLLLGRDEVIASILPHYKTDAIFRVENVDRYDDREDIRCNLIEAYERLMIFIQKHLPEKFHKEGTQRINLRDTIFHEIVANLLVHREFTHAFPAKLIIEKDQVLTENSNKSHGNGQIDLNNFSPYPKNPIIAKFFKQIGWVEELGSGIRNTAKYSSFYGRGKPQFIEADIFKSIIPIPVLSKTGLVKPETGTVKPKTEGVKPESDAVNDTVTKIVNDTVNDTVSDTVKNRIIDTIILLLKDPGQRVKGISKKLRVSEITVKRDMRKINEIVEFKGAQKTGGYFIKESYLKLLIDTEKDQNDK